MAFETQFPDKDPSDRLDYTVSFARVFEDGEEIYSAIWTVPAGIVKETSFFGANTATIVLSGGTAGQTYRLGLDVTTNQGSPARIYSRDFRIKVKEL